MGQWGSKYGSTGQIQSSLISKQISNILGQHPPFKGSIKHLNLERLWKLSKCTVHFATLPPTTTIEWSCYHTDSEKRLFQPPSPAAEPASSTFSAHHEAVPGRLRLPGAQGQGWEVLSTYFFNGCEGQLFWGSSLDFIQIPMKIPSCLDPFWRFRGSNETFKANQASGVQVSSDLFFCCMYLVLGEKTSEDQSPCVPASDFLHGSSKAHD